MESSVLKQFEGLFVEMKKNLINEMKLQENEIEWQKGDETDLSNDDRERMLKLKLVGRQSFMLKKIDNALLKIKEGTYGTCEECDGDIEINRLRARPIATQCIQCKEESERGENQMLYEKRSHTHGNGFRNVIQLKQTMMSLQNVNDL
ncbi:MAG: TraR/DksA family transcriptional regulator [Bacteriovoracaceae bacterium]|nr:TraR/DksA family transcriptional regulator [Bacteriovoracaceae bacterium]